MELELNYLQNAIKLKSVFDINQQLTAIEDNCKQLN